MDESEALAKSLARPPLPPTRDPRVGASYWPGQSDLELSKKYDTFYGSQHAPYMQPNTAYIKRTPLENIVAWRRQLASGDDRGPNVNFTLNTQEDADRLRAEAIASERSALAKLGWDPGLAVSTPPTRETIALDGLYAPKSNANWYREDAPAASQHEAMHRGFRHLYNTGKMPKGFDWNEEEAYVRALMQKAYGDVELAQTVGKGVPLAPESAGYKQIIQGRNLKDSMMADMIEKAAAEEIARKRPRGPR